MRPRNLLAVVFIGILVSAPGVHAQVVLNETFSGPATGWTTDTEWQIGPTSVGPAPVEGTYPDPAQDHSAGSDNRLAGTVLGGNIATVKHDYRWLTSPAVDVSAWPGGIQLRFWRWLNIDYAPFMSARIEVFNGSSWVLLWENGTQVPITDNAWIQQVLDLTPYKNANLRVRFGHANGVGGGFPFSGWNIDDVQIEQTLCADDDGDGHAKVACGGDDCNDANPSVYAGAPELCDGIDNNCNGQVDENSVMFYLDLDNDGYGNPNVTRNTCPQPPGYVSIAGDCNDSDASVHPGAPELCDNRDNDCDGQVDEGIVQTWYFDQDHDGYGRSIAPFIGCSPPAGYVLDHTDCDDTRANVHPGATEYCDLVDNDCDGQIDEGCSFLSIESIRDVGNDQGRNVRLTWVRAADDSVGIAQPVVSYSVWRRIKSGMAASATVSTEDATLASVLPAGNWDFVASVPALAEQRYRMVVPTLCDSTASGICWTVLLVLAHKDPATVYADAPIDSGYSVDNLIPAAPSGVMVQFIGGGARLTWEASSAPDFRQFHVYRGVDAGFDPDPSNRVYSTTALGWVDAAGTAGSVYKVTAADSSGNESKAATALGPTGAGDLPGSRTGISGIAPNPAPQWTRIRFDLATDADARLEVMDLAGRVVRRIASGSRPAGHHEISWDGRDDRGNGVAAGMYVIRLTAGSVRDTRRVVITR
jgi:hypothetical protein